MTAWVFADRVRSYALQAVKILHLPPLVGKAGMGGSFECYALNVKGPLMRAFYSPIQHSAHA